MFLNINFLLSITFAAVSDWYPDAFPEPKYLGRVWSFSTMMRELRSVETPIAIYIPLKTHSLEWMCTAIHSGNFLEPIEYAAPLYRSPKPEEFHNTYARIMCFLYANVFWYPEVYSETVYNEHMMHMKTYGLYDNMVSDKVFQEIYDCVSNGEEGCIDTLADQHYSMTKEPLDLFAFTGAFAAAWIIRSMNNDGWNHNGRWTKTGDSCTHSVNCRPYEDYTGYVSVNGPHTLVNETRWMPLVESDGTGFFYTQEHVTPQLKEVDALVGTEDQMNRNAERPNYDYMTEMELTYERVAGVTDEQIALVSLLDDKLDLIMHMWDGINDNHPLGFEESALFILGFTLAEHDATLNAWREKVRHDLIRPTSVSHYLVPEKNVTWFDGTNISSSQWQPLIRVMPHSEFPSGSSAICRATADYAQLYVEKILKWENLVTTWAMEAGGAPSKFPVIKGYPKMDHKVTFETLDELADMCSLSRLLGGMHFTASTQAGEDLVDGIGERAWETVLSLLNGDDVPAIEVDKSRMTMAPTMAETIDEESSCISSNYSWMLKLLVASNIVLLILVICLLLFVRKIFLGTKEVDAEVDATREMV
jgi:hypothetical protein